MTLWIKKNVGLRAKVQTVLYFLSMEISFFIKFNHKRVIKEIL